MTNELKKTPLYQAHQSAGAKCVDFSGWAMPLHYGSQLDEHHHVRRHAGIFDVSHMTTVDLSGPATEAFLRYLLANDVRRLTAAGMALYTCMLNADGGIIDDLIAYRLGDERYRLVVNAGTRDKDLAWIEQQIAHFKDTQLTVRDDLAMLAVQGPNAFELAAKVFPEAIATLRELPAFHAIEQNDHFFARTGYTGEDGFELLLPQADAENVWQQLLAQGIAPCGLGARDTLRLEAGMNLYGLDMDETTNPYESALGWTVVLDSPDDRDFIGRTALKQAKADGIKRQLVALVLQDRGVLRSHQAVDLDNGSGTGEITSGTFSPTLGEAIAFARVPKPVGTTGTVHIRKKALAAHLVKPPFVRQGEKVYRLKESS